MRICNFGSLNLDCVYTVDHAVLQGETIASRSREEFCGGKGLNQSIALARAGAEVFHAGCIGPDGKKLYNLLKDCGVDVRFIQQSSEPTGHAIIQLDTSGQNSILLFGGANRQITEDFVEDVISAFQPGDMLVLQNEINGIPTIMEKANQRGMRIVFNPSPLDAGINSYPLDTVEWFILNEIEGKELTGKTSPMEILKRLRRNYPRAGVLLTLGKYGSLCAMGARVYTQEIFKMPVRDTTAAGDTFLGYFVASLDRLGPEEALRLASAAAALAVSVKGAANSIPKLEDAEQTVNSQNRYKVSNHL